MATVAARVEDSVVKVRTLPPGRRYDHVFFSGMAVLILASVFLGFAHSYYLAGVFHAPLPSRIIHISWRRVFHVDHFAHNADFARRRGPCRHSPPLRHCRFPPRLPHDHPRRPGGYRSSRAAQLSLRHRRKNLLHHPNDRHVHLRRACIFCLPCPLQSLRAQTHHPHRHDRNHDRRRLPLALCHGLQKTARSGSDFLRIPSHSRGLRFVVYAQNSPRHALGQRLLDIRPTGTLPSWPNRRLARLCHLGPGAKPLAISVALSTHTLIVLDLLLPALVIFSWTILGPRQP
jgi:hypothetical protein